MTLYLIGLGLESEKDISIKGLEAIQSSSEIYLENYTSALQVGKEKLEKFYKKKIILADRDLIENKFTEKIISGKEKNISLLIPGSPLVATTHIAIFQEAILNKIPVEIIDNSSIFTAIGITGLELYKFGRTASIPFDNKNIKTPIQILEQNQKINLHTLFLLDLNPKEKKYLSIKEAINYLEKNKVSKKEKALACARLGCGNFVIRYRNLDELKNKNYGKPPYCLIIPAKKLHFMEEEMLKEWK
ncbi:diphthine synthase [Candidatus Woesearchaeota archaeon]|nr:diphthine synthase [Candidatus Woesearchaeota archaeon]